MKLPTDDLKKPFILWMSSPRTQGVFYSEVQKNDKIYIYNFRDLYGSKARKLITFMSLFKHRQCRGILVDNSGGLKILLVILLSRLFNVSIFMRLRGGMSGEFFDKIDIKNPCARYINAVWQKFKRRQLLYAAEKIFPVSIFSKSQVLYELPEVDLNRLKVLYKPVDFEAIRNTEHGMFRKKYNLDNSTKILLTATNFNYKRKYETLLNYHEIILKILSEHRDWIYVVLGGGAGLEDFKKIVERKTPKTLRNRIFITGYYPRIYEALIDADLFIYLSYRDAGPQVVKEAQACNLPVIANYSCFGSNEFIPNYYSGIDLLFEEPEVLAMLLGRFFSDQVLRKELGKINRNHAEKHYRSEEAARIFLYTILNS